MSGKEVSLLIVDNAESASAIRRMLAGCDEMNVRTHSADTLVAALNALARLPFDVVLLEIALPDSDGLTTFETVRRHARGVPIVIHTGTVNEMLALTSVERGAQDYLIKGKVNSQALARVLQYSMARLRGAEHSGKPEAVDAKVSGVLGAKGGVGATTIATHLALELRRQTGGRTLLMDLDCCAKSASLLLKLESPYSLTDAATNLHRLDSAYWSGLVAQGPHGLEALQAPGAAGPSEALSGERLRHVLRFARTMYSTIVVDLGRLNQASLHLLEETGEVYVVTTDGLPEMYEASRVVRKLRDLGFAAKNVRLVFNRVSKANPAASSALEEAIGSPAFWLFPDYSREFENAYMESRFLDEALAIRKQMALMAARTLGSEGKPAKRGMLGFLRPARA